MQPGRQIGHDEIVSALGKGGMGEVYRATDTRVFINGSDRVGGTFWFLGVTLLVMALVQSCSPRTETSTDGTREPLFENLGDLTYPITTSSELGQRYFDQGLRWTWAFNHAGAQRAFREAQRQDPNCAMCFWGEAYVLGQNINAPMEESAVVEAVEAVERARELAIDVPATEAALIDALAVRYAVGPETDSQGNRAELDQAYAAAMTEVYERFPDDPQVAPLYADAVMNTMPWDYWEADGVTPKAGIGEVIEALEKALEESPDNVGAIHLYIHLTEGSAEPGHAEGYAERLADLMPGAGHIVHMGAHTFYRIGRFKDSMDVNKRAVEADDEYFDRVDDVSLWQYGYRPHNVHWVVVSALMAGDFDTALEYADRLDGMVSDEAARIGWIQLIRQGPFFAHAHLSDPDTVLNLEDPGDAFPFVKATWHYARGVALARAGQVAGSRSEVAAIDAIAARDNVMYPADIEFIVQDVLSIAGQVVEGRISWEEGNLEDAIQHFAAAVELQDGLAYMEPPFWYYPVRQSLGAALLEADRAAEAESVFAASLERVPNNGWVLFGLMRAQQAQGNEAAAARTREQFVEAWAGDIEQLEIPLL